MNPLTYDEVVHAERLLTPDDIGGPAWILVGDGRIVDVLDSPPPDLTAGQSYPLVVPGFVDLHCHGGGGAAFTDGPEAARQVLETHRRHGTTTMLASLVTDTDDALAEQIRTLAHLVEDDELAGIHLEGPWLSPDHAGAHRPDLLAAPSVEVARKLVTSQVRMVTLAAERPGGLELVEWLRSQGVVAALGHSDATYDQTRAAIDAGITVGTHLFNAARATHHREPGSVLALLEDPRVTVELIADGVHLHPATLRLAAARAGGRFALVTDAMAAAGVGDGDYRLGPLDVSVRDGVARTGRNGTVAGSTLTLDVALRNAVAQTGLPLAAVVDALTRIPAKAIGRDDVGVLTPGSRADVVALDTSAHVMRVMRAGVWLDSARTAVAGSRGL